MENDATAYSTQKAREAGPDLHRVSSAQSAEANLDDLAGGAEPVVASEPIEEQPVTPAPRDEAPRGARIDALPLTTIPEGDSWLSNFKLFKAETQKLARVGNWRRLAAVTGHALNDAPFATRMTRTAMLLDLAQLYRDRLEDQARAEETFAVLAQEDPASSEALEYLEEVYEQRGEWGAIYDLYVAAVEATWDPNERLEWTRKAAALADDRLGKIDLAIKAWEHLWQLGDAVEDAARALTRYYRKAGRWAEMAAFLRQQTERSEGPAELVALRELAEVLLSGLKSPNEASAVLEEIVERSPQDAIATLQLARVYAQRQEWTALERLGQTAAEGEDAAARDLQHLVADALWQAGKHAQAVAAYERILEVDPHNHDGIKRKREHLTAEQRWRELLALLEERADSAENDEERIDLLAQAALLAEEKLGQPDQAIKLWESHVAIAPDESVGYVALTRLYEQLGDPQGIARALEGQLRLARDLRDRIDLLRRLGDHYAQKLGEDERAEDCWKRILSLDPSDLPTREELTELHRRRGDFESLNSSLMRQIWLTTDEDRAEKLSRMAAENLDTNFEEPARSVEAWRRVLDFKPLDKQALGQLAQHYAALDNKRELIAVLEQQIRAEHLTEERVKLAMQVAQLWRAEEVPKAAAATYERVLRWDPTHREALAALVEIYKEHDQRGKALGVLAHTGNLVEGQRRVELARSSLDLLAPDDHFARFFQLRRILFVSDGDPAVLGELFAAAEQAELWPEMAAVLQQLACEQQSDQARIALYGDLAKVYEEQLDKPTLAYLTHQAALLSPEHRDTVLEDLERLARSTERHEDLLAVLERMTTTEFDLAERKAILARRATICEKDVKAPLRAFHEQRRRLELDASDWTPIEELKRLAAAHQLWRQLDAVFAELGDRTGEESKRLELLTRREAIAREHTNDQAAAFDFLVQRYRLDDNDLELLRALTEDAESLDGWAWLLPLLEATQRAPVDQSSTDELMVTAALYEEKLEDLDRAFAIYREVFVLEPKTGQLLERLRELAEATHNHEQLADALRMAAASSEEQELTLKLLRIIASIYEDKLKAPARAIDIHRRLLDLKEDEMPSLEVVIAWHRERNEHRDLRDRLQQWCVLAPKEECRIPRLLEIARVSQQKLNDAEEALSAFGRVLELEADHDEARAGLEGLVSSITEPKLRRRWLQMQLATAEGQAAIALRLEVSKILEVDLEDVGGAVRELQALIEADERGAAGDGYEPLARLLAQRERFDELVELLQARAEKQEDKEDKLAALDEAIELCHDKLPDSHQELREQLYRSVLELRPDDHDVKVRLARLLRGAGRFEDLCELLNKTLEGAETAQQIATLYELGRVRLLNLEQPELAEKAYERIAELAGDEEGALLALAMLAKRRGDLSTYLDIRRKQAKLLNPQEAALVLCHLAEVCDETPSLKTRMVGFYREARTLDPENVPAMEALKGIGRRLKTLRPAAALLPLDGERELEPNDRASRLKALGDGALGTNLATASDWYRRAVAVDPDAPEHWAALAAVALRGNDMGAAYRARRGWMNALARAEALDPENLELEARRLYELASAAKSANAPADYARLVQQAFELVPSFAPAALARAQAQLEADDIEGASALLYEVLEHHRAELDEKQETTAFYCRGVARRALGKREQALEDFRAALRLSPLHADCLIAMGELQAELGRVAAALEHQIRALTVVEEPMARADLYYRIGVLWEDALERFDEAGACYELALAEGVDERDLLHRALRHYKRAGRLDESLDVVEGLLPTAEEPQELSTLWLVRGEILAARENAEDEAIEAFDMALSYDPGRQGARDGLVLVLERRGDFQQLLQVLEASADAGTPEQRAQALMRMAKLSAEQLGDALRAEEYLRQSVAAYPTKEALLSLEAIFAASPEREAERREVLGRLVAFGPPFFERCLELGKAALAEDKPRAWCLLSPLLGVSQIDPDIKAVVQAMRKQFERPPLRAPAAGSYDLLRHPDVHLELSMVLTELGEAIPKLGVATLKEAGDGSAITVGANTSLGKTFAALAAASNLPECTLHRTQALPDAVFVVNDPEAVRVVVRTDVMQQLVHAEVGFLFAYALELAQPSNRLLASLPQTMRDYLLPALWHVLGFTQQISPPAAALAGQIMESTEEATRESWAQTLEPLRGADPAALGQSYWQAVLSTARRAGLLAGADSRQVFRVLARMEEDVPRPKVVAKLEELDEYVAQSEILRGVIAYAATPEFAQLLADAEEVTLE
ncbi:MAG: hypothetical protein CSB49_08255 [Proteobacteria bacterium]|nr:MAG: hypothetical protein CSB49_08255 [Pseudomonadota bacterium]